MAPLPPRPPSLLPRAPAEAAATPAPLAPASIALIIVGCLALIAAGIGGAICYRWYQRRRRSQQPQHQQLPLAAPNEKAVTPIGAQKAPFSSSSLAAALKHLEYDDQPASGAAFMPPLPISRTLGPLASAFSNASLNQYMPRQQQQQQDDEEAQKQRSPLPRQSIRYDPHTSFATNCLRGLTQALDLPLELHDPSITAPAAPPLPLPAVTAAQPPPALSSSSSTSASASAFLTAGESTPAALSSVHSESSLGTGSASERRPSTTTMMSSGGETAATSVMAHEDEPMPPTSKHAIATALQSQSDQPDQVKQQQEAATPAASSTPFMSGYHHAIFPEPQADADPQEESNSGDGSGDLSSLSISHSHSHSHSHSGSISHSIRTRRQQRRRERTHANRGPSYVRARDRNASSISSRSPAHHPFTMFSPWLAAGDSTSFIQEQWRINTADESDSATRAIEAGMAFLPSLDGPGPLVEAGGSPVGGSGAAEFALVSAEGEGVGMERRPSGLGIMTLDAEGDDEVESDDGSQPSDDDDDDDASQSRDVPQRRTRRSRRLRTDTSPGSIMQNSKWASSSTPKLPTGTPKDYFTATEQQRQRPLEAEQRSFLPTVSPLLPAADGHEHERAWSPPSFLVAVQPSAAASRPHSTTSDLQSPLQRLLLGSPWDEHLARFPGPPPLAVTEAAAVKTLEERRGEVGRWRREVLPVVDDGEGEGEGVERQQQQSVPTSPSFRLRPLSLCAVSSLGLPPASATATATAQATAAAMGSGVPYTVTTVRKRSGDDTPTLASSAATATATATATAKKAKRGSFLYHISSPPPHLMQHHQQHQQRGVGVAV